MEEKPATEENQKLGGHPTGMRFVLVTMLRLQILPVPCDSLL
jgi:hypothetical protein